MYDPATGEVIDYVPAGDAEDVELAVLAGRRALEDSNWSRMTRSERGRVISRIGELMLEHADELAAIESLDNGKPVGVARVPAPARACTSSTTSTTTFSPESLSAHCSPGVEYAGRLRATTGRSTQTAATRIGG